MGALFEKIWKDVDYSLDGGGKLRYFTKISLSCKKSKMSNMQHFSPICTRKMSKN